MKEGSRFRAVLNEAGPAVRYWLREVVGGAAHRRQWKRAGIDVASVPLRKLGLDPEYAHNHASSGGPDLERVLRELGVSPEHSILDLGCGKGGALLTMADFPFNRIAGLDLSEDMLAIARQNLRAAGKENIELIHGNAVVYDAYDDFSHVYMYNPFPSVVMQAVVAHLEMSLKRVPRDLTIIYKNPKCHDDIVNSGVFVLERMFDHSGHPFNVYRPAERLQARGERQEARDNPTE